MVPDEIQKLSRWFRVNLKSKKPFVSWQKTEKNLETIEDAGGKLPLGFRLHATTTEPVNYALLDFDHIRINKSWITDEAKGIYKHILSTLGENAYREISLSGDGLHILLKPDTFLRKLSGGKHGTIFFTDNQGENAPKLEIFCNTGGRYALLTGKKAVGSVIPSGQKADAVLEWLQGLIDSKAGQIPNQQKAGTKSGADTEERRLAEVRAMLACISPDVCYDDWVAVGMALKNEGFPPKVWDDWSRGGVKYPGAEEIQKKWNKDFKKMDAGKTLATIHALAKDGGYSQKDFEKEWHKEQGYDAEEDFDSIDNAGSFTEDFLGEMLEYVRDGQSTLKKTGFAPFDDLIGGLAPKTLIVLTAPPQSGKTTFLQFLMNRLASVNPRFSCLFYCYEMDRFSLIAKDLARLTYGTPAELSAMDILQESNIGLTERLAKQYKDFSHRIRYNPLESQTDSSLSTLVTSITQGARWAEQEGLDTPIVCLDYMQLLDFEGKDEGPMLKKAMETLKNTAIQYNTTIFAISANNRLSNLSSEKGLGVSMYSGRGSSALEYGCDFQMALRKVSEGGGTLESELILTKARFIPPGGKSSMIFHGKTGFFTESGPGEFDSTDKIL